MNYENLMRQTFELAKLGGNSVIPNPMVGAIIINQNNEIISRGYHTRIGEGHAEKNAIDNCGESLLDSTLIVNLEPCNHKGRTGPCTRAIIESGIKKVVIAMKDPNPLMCGKSIEVLKKNNIEVVCGVLEAEAKILNRGFIKFITGDLPWLTLKMATTLDGKIADFSGKSKYITNEKCLNMTHQIRSESKAVLIGANTFILDESLLNVRLTACNKQPIRIIVDPNAKTLNPEFIKKSHSFHVDNQTLIFTKQCKIKLPISAKSSNIRQIEIEHFSLRNVLRELKLLEINNILCEGGAKIAGLLLEDGLVDEIYWFLSPMFINDNFAINALDSDSKRPLSNPIKLLKSTTHAFDDNILIHGYTERGLSIIN